MFHYQKQDSQDVQEINIQIPQKDKITLTSDDNYSILLQPVRDYYVYIYQLNSYGKLVKIFPNQIYSSFQNPLRQEEIYRFPSRPNWFYLTKSKGKERIYITAFIQQKRDWENLYAQYDKEKKGAKKQEIFSRLLKEIEDVEQNSSEEAFGWVLVFN
jgi:hypothetical protein